MRFFLFLLSTLIIVELIGSTKICTNRTNLVIVIDYLAEPCENETNLLTSNPNERIADCQSPNWKIRERFTEFLDLLVEDLTESSMMIRIRLIGVEYRDSFESNDSRPIWNSEKRAIEIHVDWYGHAINQIDADFTTGTSTLSVDLDRIKESVLDHLPVDAILNPTIYIALVSRRFHPNWQLEEEKRRLESAGFDLALIAPLTSRTEWYEAKYFNHTRIIDYLLECPVGMEIEDDCYYDKEIKCVVDVRPIRCDKMESSKFCPRVKAISRIGCQEPDINGTNGCQRRCLEFNGNWSSCNRNYCPPVRLAKPNEKFHESCSKLCDDGRSDWCLEMEIVPSLIAFYCNASGFGLFGLIILVAIISICCSKCKRRSVESYSSTSLSSSRRSPSDSETAAIYDNANSNYDEYETVYETSMARQKRTASATAGKKNDGKPKQEVSRSKEAAKVQKADQFKAIEFDETAGVDCSLTANSFRPTEDRYLCIYASLDSSSSKSQ